VDDPGKARASPRVVLKMAWTSEFYAETYFGGFCERAYALPILPDNLVEAFTQWTDYEAHLIPTHTLLLQTFVAAVYREVTNPATLERDRYQFTSIMGDVRLADLHWLASDEFPALQQYAREGGGGDVPPRLDDTPPKRG
jgi:hypothetical protein